jgi:hypothetical protein
MEDFEQEILGGEDIFSFDDIDDTAIEESVKDTKETKSPVIKDEEEDDIDDFSFDDEDYELKETKEKTDVVQDKKLEKPVTSSSSLVSKLSKFGLLEDVVDEEGNPLDLSTVTEEEEEDLINDLIESRSQKSLEKLVGSLPKELKELNEFVIKGGGSVSEYLKSLNSETVDYFQYDDLPEEKLESFLKRDLMSAGYDDEEIDIQIKSLKNSDKLESYGAKRFDKWKKKEEGDRKVLVEESKKRNQQRKQESDKFQNEVKTVLNSKDIGGLKISSKQAQDLHNYITTPIADEKGRNMPQVHRDILSAFEDPKKLAILAAIAKDNFDLSKLGKQFKVEGKQEVTKRINHKTVPISQLF